VCYYHHSSPLSGNVTNVYDDDDDDDDDVFVNDVAFVHSIKMRYLNRANKYKRPLWRSDFLRHADCSTVGKPDYRTPVE